MPKSTCLTCHRLIPLGASHCSAHVKARKPRQRAKSVDRGFTHEYRKNRGIVLSISRVCILCGGSRSNTADHLQPRTHGGNNSLHNLAPAHLSCNSSRQAKPLSPEQWERVEAYRVLLADYLSQ